MVLYIVPALIAFAVLVALVGVRAMAPQRERVDERLQTIRDEYTPGAVGGVPSPSLTESSLPAFWRATAQLGWILPHLVQSDDLQWELAQAGVRHREARGLYAGAKVALALALGLGVLLLAGAARVSQQPMLLSTVAAAGIGFFLPNLWLAIKKSRRHETLQLALPDALDLTVICVEAGQGLNSAIVTVGNEMRRACPELSEELRLISSEIRAGLTRAQALRNFAWRTGVDEARALVAVLVQSDRLGTSIARALRVHADSMRVRRRQRAEEAARKTAVKLVFPLVFCIFPELLVVILAPGMIQLIRVLADSQ